MTNSAPFDFSEIVHNAKDAVIVTKAEPIDYPGPEIVYANKAFCEMTGYSAQEVIGKNPRILQSEKTEKKETSAIRKALEKQESIRVTLRNLHQSGQGILDRSQYPSSSGQKWKIDSLCLHPKRYYTTKEPRARATGSLPNGPLDYGRQPQGIRRNLISGILKIQKKSERIRSDHDRHRPL